MYKKYKGEERAIVIAILYAWGLENHILIEEDRRIVQDRLEQLKELSSNYTEEALFINNFFPDNTILDIIKKYIDSEDILNKVLECSEPVLARKKDITFTTIIKKYNNSTKEKLKSIYKKLFNLYNGIMMIRSELIITIGKDEKIGHYAKVSRLKSLLRGSDEPGIKNPQLWIFNVSHMNDPLEGKALIEYLKSVEHKSSTDNLDKLSEKYNQEFEASNIYLSSLTKAIDSLPMWSMYGDNGQGCCLLFDSDFFDVPDDKFFDSTIKSRSFYDNSEKSEEKEGERDDHADEKFPLYRIYYLPKKEDLDSKTDLKGYLEELSEIINDISFEGVSHEEEDKIWELIMDSLDEIRYLFKSEDYEYEKEYRILKSVGLDNKDIKLSKTEIPRLYIEHPKVPTYKEVILGPKVNEPNNIAPFISYCSKGKIKISKSKIKYR